MMALPVTQIVVNDFLVSDALLDTGSQISLINSRVFDVVAPNVHLNPPARLISASGHELNARGKYVLKVKPVSGSTHDVEFTVVENLGHDVVLGWDFLSESNAVLNCSPRQEAKLKLRIKKPVSVPPRSAVCLTVKVDQTLSDGEEYLFVGQRVNNVEICDALLKPFSACEIPLYVRNRSDQLVTIHRRSVLGYVECVNHAFGPIPENSSPGANSGSAAAEVNAVSADDGQFLGMGTEDVLSGFVLGELVTGPRREKVAALLRSFPGVFSRGYSDIGLYRGGDVNLELKPGVSPQFVKPYPVPWAREQQMRAQLDELQACGVVEKGQPADWNSPVLLVPKGKNSKEFRIVQDMRSLNKCLTPKKFAFPTIDEFLFSLHGWKVASTLDIKHAFWNLRLSDQSSEMCAFYALGTTYYPRRMPMGCAQSSYFLNLAVHKVLGDLPGTHIYADDLLLTSPSLEEHYTLLHTVLSRLRDAGMKVAPEKCRLFQTKLLYLGHEITPEGIAMDPDRTRVISEMAAPRTLKEAKRLFGFYSWFRKFIPSFTTLSEPLVLLCNAERFYWNDDLDRCCNDLRQALLNGQALSYPRKDGRFLLYTDSSTSGSGQILCQIQDGTERVIAFGGSRYSRAQRKWTVFELEVFSFIQGLKKFF